MYRTAATCSLMLLLWAVAPAMEEVEQTVSGTVVSVTATKLTSIELPPPGEEPTDDQTSFVINDDTTITKNIDEKATAKDLTAGAEVTVAYVERDEQFVAVSIDVVPPAPPEEEEPPVDIEPDVDFE